MAECGFESHDANEASLGLLWSLDLRLDMRSDGEMRVQYDFCFGKDLIEVRFSVILLESLVWLLGACLA
jgi:hypothetical protein